jgi:Caspase domain
MQNGGSFTLNFSFGPRSRIFGLIISIDRYISHEIPDLQGCKRDAQSIMDFLSNRFHVPSHHLMCLADEKATRSAILKGFQSHLIENSNIQSGDAIIVFYAGHGSRTAAPEGWVADGNKIETICPHDERTLDRNGVEILGIPDRTIDGLLRRVASTKGDNIVRLSRHSKRPS